MEKSCIVQEFVSESESESVPGNGNKQLGFICTGSNATWFPREFVENPI